MTSFTGKVAVVTGGGSGLHPQTPNLTVDSVTQNQESATFFQSQDRAVAYDTQTAKLAPIFDVLYFLMGRILADLPADARFLCVGVGTGTELIKLAQAFPHWHFTAVDPTASMLNICRQKAEENGIMSRCTFHEGDLDSLPTTDAFDGATCLLVSQIFIQTEERGQFFQQIAARLRPLGYLVTSDLAADMSTPAYQSLVEIWQRSLQYAETPIGEIEKIRAALGTTAAGSSSDRCLQWL